MGLDGLLYVGAVGSPTTLDRLLYVGAVGSPTTTGGVSVKLYMKSDESHGATVGVEYGMESDKRCGMIGR